MKAAAIKASLLMSAIVLGACLRLGAATIYNNSTNDLNTRFDPGTVEIGDEIILAGTERFLTNFSFEYWNTASGSVNAEVRFYLNDGPLFNGYATPGTMFWDSGVFALNPTTRSTAIFDNTSDFPFAGLYLPLPSTNMTWSVQFSSLGGGNAGVDLFSPPVVGGNHTDYWENDGGTWNMKTNAAVTAMSFGATMEAQIPEPSTLALSVVGGILITVGFGRRFARRH